MPLDATREGEVSPYAIGDCFEATVGFAIERVGTEDEDKFRLVHGVVSGSGQIDGVRHVHAWIEVGDLCLNISASGRTGLYRSLFYRAGKIGRTVRYTLEDAVYLAVNDDDCGPWDDGFKRAQELAIEQARALTEE